MKKYTISAEDYSKVYESLHDAFHINHEYLSKEGLSNYRYRTLTALDLLRNLESFDDSAREYINTGDGFKLVSPIDDECRHIKEADLDKIINNIEKSLDILKSYSNKKLRDCLDKL